MIPAVGRRLWRGRQESGQAGRGCRWGLALADRSPQCGIHGVADVRRPRLLQGRVDHQHAGRPTRVGRWQGSGTEGEESEQQGVAEVILAKHRNGPTGMVKLSWLRRYAKFADLAAA